MPQPIFPQPTSTADLIDYINCFLALKGMSDHLRNAVTAAREDIRAAGKAEEVLTPKRGK